MVCGFKGLVTFPRTHRARTLGTALSLPLHANIRPLGAKGRLPRGCIFACAQHPGVKRYVKLLSLDTLEKRSQAKGALQGSSFGPTLSVLDIDKDFNRHINASPFAMPVLVWPHPMRDRLPMNKSYLVQ